VSSLKEYIPKVITSKNISWLESWNFSCGYLIERDYLPFENLYIEHDRTVLGLNKIPEWLLTGDRIEIAKSLPAGQRFFSVLGEFRNSINQHIIGSRLNDGTQILSVTDLPNKQKIISQWKSKAEYFSQVYRQDILGQAEY